MRPRSLIGPVLLIVIGGLFLMNNLRPDIPVFRLVSTYWPFLLIGWGLLRLVEVALAMIGDRPLPQGRLSGGEIALVILICLIGSGMYMANRHMRTLSIGPFGHRGVEIFGEQFDYPVSGQQAIPGVQRILFENLRGNIRVAGGDVPEIRITGRKTIRAFSRAEADQADKLTPLVIVLQGSLATVRTNQERVTDERRMSADLEVTVPRGVRVEGRGRYGDYDILNVDGGIDVNSDNAGVRLTQIGGDVRVDLRRSDIIRAIDVKGKLELQSGRGSDVELENIAGPVTLKGAFSGDLEFRKLAQPLHFSSRQTELTVARLPGEIRMDLGRLTGTKLVGPIRLTTRSRDISIEEFTESLELELERGDVDLRPKDTPLARINARSRSGDIQIALPKEARFQLKAETKRGEAQNEFGPALKVETENQGAVLSGAVGKGPEITLLTQRGTVTVRKE